MYALDISNWQGEISDATIACWRDAGIGHLIVRASLETNAAAQLAQRQMDAALRGGLGLSVYQWCYWDWDPRQTVDWTRQLVGDRPVWSIWQDAEDPVIGRGADDIARWLRSAAQRYDDLGARNGVYTGKWWWDRYMRGRADLADRPLWDANYDGLPRSGFVPYGGWERDTISQFSSSYSLCGATLDINWVDDGFLQETRSTDMNAAQETVVDDQGVPIEVAWLDQDLARATGTVTVMRMLELMAKGVLLNVAKGDHTHPELAGAGGAHTHEFSVSGATGGAVTGAAAVIPAGPALP